MKIDSGIIEIQKKLGLPGEFFEKLLEEDDWSFVIKLHALIEAVCSSFILYHLREPALEKIISRLEISNTTVGKVAILKALDLLGDEYRKYIRSLSELRNDFVHNVKNCHSTLPAIIDTLSKDRLKQFAKDFAPTEMMLMKFDNINIKGKSLLSEDTKRTVDIKNIIERAKNHPKLHIWLGAYNMLVSIVDMHGYSDYLQYEKFNKMFEDDDEEGVNN